MLLEMGLIELQDEDKGGEFRRYYLKSHELLLMLENSSEAEGAGS